MEQIAIALTGVVAIWLSQDHRIQFRKWASIFGLIGQPFWFYSAYSAEQWGIFSLCFFYQGRNKTPSFRVGIHIKTKGFVNLD